MSLLFETTVPHTGVHPISNAWRMAPEMPFDDIWSPLPEANMVIPGWGIAPGPVHLVTGTWYTGKTLLLMTVGLAVASGKDLFGLWGVKRGKWIHFDHEMGERGIKRYIQRLRGGLEYDIEALRDRVSLRVLPQLNLCSENAIELYTELLSGCSLCTIDPLRAATPGADENSSEFRRYTDMLATVSDRTKCPIKLLHHGGKPTQEALRRNTGRGSSAIDDSVQSKFVLSAEEKGAPMLFTHEKTRELDKPLEDFYLEFVNGPGSVYLAHRLPEEMEEKKRRTRVSLTHDKAVAELRSIVLSHGGELRGSRTDLLALIKGDRNVASKALSALIASGELRREGTYHQPVWKLHNTCDPI